MLFHVGFEPANLSVIESDLVTAYTTKPTSQMRLHRIVIIVGTHCDPDSLKRGVENNL